MLCRNRNGIIAEIRQGSEFVDGSTLLPSRNCRLEVNEMPKSTKSSSTKRMAGRARAKSVAKDEIVLSPEYKEYLERYAEFGEGRPRLSPAEFDRLDDELLELLDLSGHQLNDEQIVRIQELEFLLIDSE